MDLTLKGEIDFSILSKVKSQLGNDLTVPYFFDVIDYQSITNPDLKKHIDQFGKIFFSAQKEIAS